MSNEMADEFGFDKPKKRHTFLIVFICLILGIAIGGAGVGYYLVEIDNPFEKKEVVKKDSKEKTLDKDNYLVKTLLSRVHNNDVKEADMQLYASDYLIADDLDSTYVNYLIANEAKRQMIGTDGVLDSKTLQSALNTIFGSFSSFIVPEEDFGECPTFTYDSEDGVFTEEDNKCKVDNNIDIQRTIVKAILSDKKIEIYEAVAFINNEENKIYTKIDANGELSEELVNFDLETFVIERDYSRVNTYKYVFSYDDNTSNYVFESLSLEK